MLRTLSTTSEVMASYPRPDTKVSRGAPKVPVRRTAGPTTPMNVVPLKPLLPAVAEKPVLYVKDSSEGLTAQPPLHISESSKLGSPACESPDEEGYEVVLQEFQHPPHSAPNTSVSQEEAKGPSVYDINEKDVVSFKPGDGVKDESEDINRRRRSPKAKDCGDFVRAVCCISCLLCLWPVNCICLCLACYTSVKVNLGIL